MTDKTSTTKQSTSKRPSGSDRRKGSGGGKTFADRVKDVDQKILDIRRVTRVVAGGRRMSFAVSMVIGDKTGVVGVGTGKGGDTALAIAKALKSAKKNAIKIKKTESHSIPMEVGAKYCSSRVVLFPNKGKGLVAGAAVRDILIIAGVRDVTSKVLSGSKNKLNTAKAVIKALGPISTKHSFANNKVEVETENNSEDKE
ncbi:30S ribosomal protein S5 [Candidatus Nomurabacteria bacterium]|nr:30S ribosomal protein S5 [Candidatus Nomurabacteria bacterium]